MVGFCETCPIRGECHPNQELKAFMITLSDGQDDINTSQLFDESGNTSKIFVITNTENKIPKVIDDCEAPKLISKGILRRELIEICGGLGNVSLVGEVSEIADIFSKLEPNMKQTNHELWHEM